MRCQSRTQAPCVEPPELVLASELLLSDILTLAYPASVSLPVGAWDATALSSLAGSLQLKCGWIT